MKNMKKHVSVVGLLRIIRTRPAKVPNHDTHRIKLVDCLMPSLAIFIIFAGPLLAM